MLKLNALNGVRIYYYVLRAMHSQNQNVVALATEQSNRLCVSWVSCWSISWRVTHNAQKSISCYAPVRPDYIERNKFSYWIILQNRRNLFIVEFWVSIHIRIDILLIILSLILSSIYLMLLSYAILNERSFLTHWRVKDPFWGVSFSLFLLSFNR